MQTSKLQWDIIINQIWAMTSQYYKNKQDYAFKSNKTVHYILIKIKTKSQITKYIVTF